MQSEGQVIFGCLRREGKGTQFETLKPQILN